LDYRTTYSLPDLELAVGPHESATVRLAGPVLLNVEFIYEAGYPARPPQAIGDPGDPGLPAMFDFKRVVTPHPLVLTSRDGDMRLVISSGTDIYPLLTYEILARIETDLVDAHQASRIDARVDRAVIERAVDFGALQ